MTHPDEPKPAFRMAQYASVGLEMGIAIPDVGTNPWLMLVGLLLGTAAGFKGLFDAAKKAKRSLESKDPR